ncbi:hypothetical protein E4T43_05252 [Aureobasidium subglaciale]|nr:hypothetical protein E4T43_05252 [Aureobasidium subglaciale]
MRSAPPALVGMDTPTTSTIKKHTFTNALLTISLQLLLWSSLFPLSIQIFLFALSKVDASLFLADILCIAAAGTSLLVILLHIVIVRLRDNIFSNWAKVAAAVFKVMILFASCTAVLLWITTVGLGIILALARQPTCRPASADTHDLWRKGRICVLQRIALVVSMLSFIVSFILCFAYNVSHDPFAAGLFGSRQPNLCLSPSDLQRSPQMAVKRHSTLSFKCRSALLSPIAVSSPLRISSPLRRTMSINVDKPDALGISSPRLSIEKSPLLSKSPSQSSAHSSVRSNDTTDSSQNQLRPTTYIPSTTRTYQPSRVPTDYVPSPHGTHLYSPKRHPKAIASPLRVEAPIRPVEPYALRRVAPAIDTTPVHTTSLYTSRRVSSTFLTPTSMIPPLMTNSSSPMRESNTHQASTPVHMPLTRPINLYSSRRAPTPFAPTTYATDQALPKRDPRARGLPDYSTRVPSTMLAPPPSIRQLNSARRGVSYASNTSSIYSRHVNDV